MVNIEDLLEQAKNLQLKDKHVQAIPIFTEAIAIMDTQDPKNAGIFNDRGFSYVMSGKPEEAYTDNKVVLALTDAPENEKARALIDMSYIERTSFDDLEKSRKSLESALNIETQPSSLRGKALDFLARTYVWNKDSAKAIPLCKEAIQIYDKLAQDDPIDFQLKRRKADVGLILGTTYVENEMDASAEELIPKVLAEYKEIDDFRGKCNIYNLQGKIALKCEQADEAAKYFQQALSILDDNEPGHQDYVTSSSLGLSEAFLILKDNQQASQHLERLRDGIIPDYHQSGTKKKLFGDNGVNVHNDSLQNIRRLYQETELTIPGMDKIFEKI